jgi:hypothetical protein
MEMQVLQEVVGFSLLLCLIDVRKEEGGGRSEDN